MENSIKQISINPYKKLPSIGTSSANEIQNFIGELERTIERNDASIDVFKKELAIANGKIPESEDYIRKYQAEKRVNLDKVNAELIKKNCYKNGFKFPYQAKLMKIIFESVLLEKVEEAINTKVAQKASVLSNEDTSRLRIREEVLTEVTWDFFKRLCFDPWRFKNNILACDEFIVLNFDPNSHVSLETTLKNVMDELENIRNEALTFKDKDLEEIFIHLLNTLLVIVYLTICYRRLKLHREEIARVTIILILD